MGMFQCFCLSVILILAIATLARGLHDAAAAVEAGPFITAALFRQLPSPNESRLDRMIRSVKISKKRHNAIAYRMLSAAAANTSTDKDLVTPVSALPTIHEYGMVLNVGTPPVTFKGIIDTGSDLIWVKSDPYKGPPGVGPIFHPKASATYKPILCTDQKCADLQDLKTCGSSTSCRFEEKYGDGTSISGGFATETITLFGLDGKPQAIKGISFGCLNTGSQEVADLPGLFGLGKGKISFVSQLGSLIQNKFSYCLLALDAPTTAKSKLVFGASAALQGPGIQVIPIIPSPLLPSFYMVDLQAVSVGAGKPIAIPPVFVAGGTLIDSGTTLTILQPTVLSKVEAAFKSLVKLPEIDYSIQGFSYCLDASSQPAYQFPNLTLHFQHASIALPHTNSFIKIDDANPNAYCLGVIASSPDLKGLQIIGNVMQQNYQLLFDLGKSQLSWKPTKCDSL